MRSGPTRSTRKKVTRTQLVLHRIGVSGGEEGARFGPSLMAGGSSDAWAQIEDAWRSISAKVDSESGKPIQGGSPWQASHRGSSMCGIHR